MKELKRKNQPDNLQKTWKEAARFYESDDSLKVLEQGEPLAAVERRKLLGPGKKKLISVRLPEDDLEALKIIAKKHDRSYQQLFIQAIEHFLDDYQRSALSRK